MERTKNITKRLLSVMLSLAMVFSLVQGGIFTAIAETSGDYEYELLEDGTVEIIGYYGEATELTIPSEIDSKAVTSIGYDAFWDCDSLISVVIPDTVKSISSYALGACDSLTSVTIGSSVESIAYNAFNSSFALTEIKVSENNAYFSEINGILFNKEKTELIYYPTRKTDTSYEIPNTVEVIASDAFDDCDFLESVTIGSSVNSVTDEIFVDCSSLTTIKVSEENESFSAVDGVLYNKDKTKLFKYPEGKTNESYVIPDTVTEIYSSESLSNTKIKSITISAGMKDVDAFSFLYCTELESFTVPEDNDYFSSKDGVLYNKDKTELIKFPNNYPETSYTTESFVKSIGIYAFGFSYSLESITVGNSVESISNSAFENSSALASATIGDSVESIGAYVFDGTALYNNEENWDNGLLYIDNYLIDAADDIEGDIAIKEETRLIADQVFNYCSSITSIVIPNSVKSIDYSAFQGCSALESVTIGNSVKSIGEYAFHNCTSLTNVVIPNSVKSIGYSAFQGCSELVNVTLGTSLESIDDNVFTACESLASVTVQVGNTNFVSENGVLYNIDKTELICYPTKNTLTSYVIPDTVKSIKRNIFEGCSTLESITIGVSVEEIIEGAFSDCDALVNITVADGNTKYASEDGVLYNKDKTELIYYPVGKTTGSFVIPNTVEYIYSKAFYNCNKLSSVTIPESVCDIGSEAFWGCTKLADIKIGKNVDWIGHYAFSDTAFYANEENWENSVLYLDNYLLSAKYNISGEYKIKEGTTLIADSAFYDCSELTSVVFPSSFKYIGYYAFEECSALTSVTLENGLEYIGECAFAECTSLQTISIPNSVKEIDYGAFEYCTKLSNITLPDKIEFIGDRAFYKTAFYNIKKNWDDKVLYMGDCLIVADESITGEYKIKEGTRMIADEAFSECANLTAVTIPNSVTIFCGDTFEECSSLTTVTVPGSVRILEEESFEDCINLKSVVIEDGVEAIKFQVFNNCKKLTTITIPNSVKTISEEAFVGCDSLTTINFLGTKAQWEKIIIDEGNEALSKANIIYNCQHKIIVTDKAVAPTCDKTGLTEGSHCKECGAKIKAQTTVKAKGHSTTVKNKKSATYFAKGYSGDTVCKVCKKTIKKGKATAKKTLKTPKVKVTKGKKQFKVKYNKVSGATGFEVQYKIGKKAVTKSFNTKKSATKNIIKLKKGSYKVKVRAFVKSGKKKAYSKWTKTYKVNVK